MTFLQWARTQWDRVAAWCFVALGGLAIVLGWVGVGREALTAQQIPYVVSGGIGGLFLLGVGAMLWLSADLRDEWRKLDALEGRARQPVQEGTPAVVHPAARPEPTEPLPGEIDGASPSPRRRRPLTPAR